jgi:predicted nucleotidyltransferase component of viral defense system
MAFSEPYRRQVALLVRALPAVAAEECFALKGGTAINLFVRALPRLSVDIDLTYLPIEPRAPSLRSIDAALRRIADRIRQSVPGALITEARPAPENMTVRLTVRSQGVQIKIEVTPVLRGCVYEPEWRRVSEAVEDEFGFAEMRVVSFADLYAGKIVAALDRQHPRDLFDVRDLLANEGITDALREAFIIYLISHNRPMAEVLAPTRKPLDDEFDHGFAGMTAQPVALSDLAATREALIAAIVGEMPDAHRAFLLSFKRGEPQWPLLATPEAARLPAVLWRQQNLDKLSSVARAALIAGLEAVLATQR